MTTTALHLSDRLAASAVHQAFREHPFFAAVDSSDLTREQAAVLLEQWWHPLHYFPTFLAGCVAALPDIGSKCAIASILSEETGEGEVSRAHEVIYADSMAKCGFDRARVTGTPPLPETAALVAGYARASGGHESAVGAIYATETTDLLMVSAIGTVITRTTGVTDNEWVTIHVAQEPGHVAEANHALMGDFPPAQEEAVLAAADEMWALWTSFFDRLAAETGLGAGPSEA